MSYRVWGVIAHCCTVALPNKYSGIPRHRRYIAVKMDTSGLIAVHTTPWLCSELRDLRTTDHILGCCINLLRIYLNEVLYRGAVTFCRVENKRVTLNSGITAICMQTRWADTATVQLELTPGSVFQVPQPHRVAGRSQSLACSPHCDIHTKPQQSTGGFFQESPS